MVRSTQISKVKHEIFLLLNDSLYLNKSKQILSENLRRTDGQFLYHQASLMAIDYTTQWNNLLIWTAECNGEEKNTC